MLRLRDPAWMFGLLALAIYLGVGLAVSVAFIAEGKMFAAPHAQALMWPAAIAAAIAGGAIGPRLRRGQLNRRIEIVQAAALAGAVSGLAWPLSFGASAALNDGVQILLESLKPAALGALIGAVAGAVGGAASAYLTTAKR